ncbi:MAG: Flp1 family type IVb pilin [Pseudomonadota bacterium]|nr:Flp1 family type IVb pilin [Pseudomonadota bacterium]
MKNIRKFISTLWKDESAQGATEYILLLVAVVAVVLMFKGKIMTMVEGMMSNLQGSISGATGN